MRRFILLANPRTGSTYLAGLLRMHPRIGLADELLNIEKGLKKEPLDYIAKELSQFEDSDAVGFKVFPEQLIEHEIRFDDLVRYLGIEVVIVLWRTSLLEQFTSRQIASQTGVWYEGPYQRLEKQSTVTTHIDEIQLKEYHSNLVDQWQIMGRMWPIDVVPLFVEYSHLTAQTSRQIERILSVLSLDPQIYPFFRIQYTIKKLTNVSERIENWKKLSNELKSLTINVESIIKASIEQNMRVSPEVLHLVPDCEPRPPSGGWLYTVSAPYIPDQGIDNVMMALGTGSVSSAGYWPRLMTTKLKRLFSVPVAQPCCNGFSAIVVALQCVGIGPGDQVIVPSLTMIAVANAVKFLGAKPVFADCAADEYNPGVKEILKCASDQTKAVILCHTYGVPTRDLLRVVDECRRRKWFLIEDISECVGVKIRVDNEDRLLGTFGDLSCASLYANKIVHSADGGFILANDRRLEARLKSLVNHGFTPNYHFLHTEVAINCKINGLGAALACASLDHLEEVVGHRAQLAQWYRNKLSGLPIELMPVITPNDTPWVFGFKCDSKLTRTKLRAHLAVNGIESRDFFFPLHLQPALNQSDDIPRLPLAETLGSTGFYLPTHYHLNQTDIDYITNVIREFFGQKEGEYCRPDHPIHDFIMIRSGQLNLEVISHKTNGEIVNSLNRGHPLIEAVFLAQEANKCLIHERWDERQLLLSKFQELMEATKVSKSFDPKIIENYFKDYIEYFESQKSFEKAMDRQWLSEDLTSAQYRSSQSIPTTTDTETLQLMCHLVRQYRPNCIVELGSWMGRSTLLMALAAKTFETPNNKTKIYACDEFKWQTWMNNFVSDEHKLFSGRSFLDKFLLNTKDLIDCIEPVVMNFDNGLPDQLKNIRNIDFLVIDFTQEPQELNFIWNSLKHLLIPNRTVVLFNGLSKTSIPFLTKISDQMKPIAKPMTIAKAFIFQEQVLSDEQSLSSERSTPSPVKLKFCAQPDWTHLNGNAFNAAIDELKSKLECHYSDIVFVAAVENSICDEPNVLLTKRWVGIIHSTVTYGDSFYVPDLERLCSRRFDAMFRNCCGLFTLTDVQRNYLIDNLKFKIPIQTILYPIATRVTQKESKVIEILESDRKLDLVFIGEFARDFEFFSKALIPNQFRKVILGEQNSRDNGIIHWSRLSEEEYEELLFGCLPFLALKYEGAANTLVIECIARNVPIVVPNMDSCLQYIGSDYPLIYDRNNPDISEVLTTEKIKSAIEYLKRLDKTKFSVDRFVEDVTNGIVLNSLSPIDLGAKTDRGLFGSEQDLETFDVTISIISYKRSDNLPKILDSLWNRQTFEGKFEIIVWNNNESRKGVIDQICDQYVSAGSAQKRLTLISSTQNYYCAMRLSLAHLMKSDCLLICDDDIIPGERFVQFFVGHHKKYPRDVLCVRGHVFLEHTLNSNNPTNVWSDYESLRFRSDESEEQLIHFFHADACVVPKNALHECGSVPMPDPTFALVDDYWMSYVLNHMFGRKLRKLSINGLSDELLTRTPDSDQLGLALHTRPEVQSARLRLYIHHMINGWPKWPNVKAIDFNSLRKEKIDFWSKTFVGFNISSDVTESDIEFLRQMRVRCVRVGAVGLGDKLDFEFSGFVTDIEHQFLSLKSLLSKLKAADIRVVVTLCRKISSPELWRTVAKELSAEENVVGYDLINEPFTLNERNYNFEDIDDDLPKLMVTYEEMIRAIRESDKSTPIVVESSYWAHIDFLDRLDVKRLQSVDNNLLYSFHFYEPQQLTSRAKNQNRFGFPGYVDVLDSHHWKSVLIDYDFITSKLEMANAWAEKHGVKLVVGEVGISRDVVGADKYLSHTLKMATKRGMSSFVYSFRDREWDSMDYELGMVSNSGIIRKKLSENNLMQVIIERIGVLGVE